MSKTFREQALEEVRNAFGEPEYINVTGGQIFRWILKREHGSHLYITIDSPEIPSVCHIMISDPSSKAVEPISNMTLRTLEEVKSVIKRIERQWHAPESSTEEAQVGLNDYLKIRTHSKNVM
jgi:hypothetical protein